MSALLLLMSTNAASDDLPVIGPCDVALGQMEAVLVARVDGVTLEEYAVSHSVEMMVVATLIYKAKEPAAEIQRRHEECLRGAMSVDYERMSVSVNGGLCIWLSVQRVVMLWSTGETTSKPRPPHRN